MAKKYKADHTPEEWAEVLTKARAYRKLPKAQATRRAYRQKNRAKLCAAAAEWHAKNPEKVKDKRKRYHATDKGIRMSREYWQKFVKENPEYIKLRDADRITTPDQRRKWNLNRQYALSPESYMVLLNSQGGVCAICSKPDSGKGSGWLAVDHNHTTGRNRGLLCRQCNGALASMESDPDWGTKALAYLVKYIEQTVLEEMINCPQ